MISIRHSDLDFLVEFERGAPCAFKTYFGFKESLEALFGRRVDLVERDSQSLLQRERRALARADL
jgi:predicted nucleotidyltransferase